MTALFRRTLTGAALAVMAAGLASADTIIGYMTTIGPTATDLVNNNSIVLPSWNPGDSNATTSNVSGGVYTTGISMASLNAPGTTYTLVGYNITVKETLTGGYTVTNNASTTLTGSLFTDTYTAVALDAPLSPPLTNITDPTNDLYACSKTGVGLPSPCTQGEQVTSLGGGPDPNTPLQSNLTVAPGGTFTVSGINVTSKWVDYGCEVTTGFFCNENSQLSAAGNDLTSNLGLLKGPPDLTFYLSTVTQLDAQTSGGNGVLTNSTFVTEQVSVTYDYTASSSAPEPTTMALMGGALLGLGLLGKRFKKS